MYFKHWQGTAHLFSVSLSTLPVLTKTDTRLSLPLPLSLTYLKHLQHISLSLYALQALYK